MSIIHSISIWRWWLLDLVLSIFNSCFAWYVYAWLCVPPSLFARSCSHSLSCLTPAWRFTPLFQSLAALTLSWFCQNGVTYPITFRRSVAPYSCDGFCVMGTCVGQKCVCDPLFKATVRALLDVDGSVSSASHRPAPFLLLICVFPLFW